MSFTTNTHNYPDRTNQMGRGMCPLKLTFTSPQSRLDKSGMTTFRSISFVATVACPLYIPPYRIGQEYHAGKVSLKRRTGTFSLLRRQSKKNVLLVTGHVSPSGTCLLAEGMLFHFFTAESIFNWFCVLWHIPFNTEGVHSLCHSLTRGGPPHLFATRPVSSVLPGSQSSAD